MIFGRNYKGYPVLIALDGAGGQVSVKSDADWQQVGRVNTVVQVALTREVLLSLAKAISMSTCYM